MKRLRSWGCWDTKKATTTLVLHAVHSSIARWNRGRRRKWKLTPSMPKIGETGSQIRPHDAGPTGYRNRAGSNSARKGVSHSTSSAKLGAARGERRTRRKDLWSKRQKHGPLVKKDPNEGQIPAESSSRRRGPAKTRRRGSRGNRTGTDSCVQNRVRHSIST